MGFMGSNGVIFQAFMISLKYNNSTAWVKLFLKNLQKKRFESVQTSADPGNVSVVFFVWRTKSSSPGGG